jgi:pimeloyl-ACP methyl ester carboxylesterase
MTTAPTERDYDVNGITIHAATWGELTSPDRAILLVHGITANSRTWMELGPRLAGHGWFPIAVDLRGRGRSAKPPHGYGLPFHVNDLLSLCDTLGIEQVNYLGHSLGALIGLFLAAVHPGRVNKLVLVDAGGKLPPDTMEAIAPALARVGMPYPSLDAYLEATTSGPHFPTNQRAFWRAYYRYDAQQLPDGQVTSSMPKAALLEEQATMFLTRTDVLPEYVKAPTLIVRATEGLLGGDRGLLLPREEAERLHSLIADSEVVEIPRTNHYTVVLDPAFTEAVKAFFGARTDGTMEARPASRTEDESRRRS